MGVDIRFFPENITWWEIITKGIPIVATLVFGTNILKRISEKVSPHKEIKCLLDQVNVCYQNIKGKIYYRKNGTIHIRFVNMNSPYKDKLMMGQIIELLKMIDGKYKIISCDLYHDDLPFIVDFENYEDYKRREDPQFFSSIEGLVVSIDELRKLFECLNRKKGNEDFRENVEKFIKKAERKNFILKHKWISAPIILPDFERKASFLERNKIPEYCLITRMHYCYVLKSGIDSKIDIKALPVESFDKIYNDYPNNFSQNIHAAKMIANIPPNWMPEFFKRFRTYYPWGCTVSQLFDAIKYWERKGYKFYNNRLAQSVDGKTENTA